MVPLFVLGFVALAGLRTTGWLSPAVLDAAAVVQDMLLGMALFGLGSAVRVGPAAAHRRPGAAGRAGVLAADRLLGLAAACLMFAEPAADRCPHRSRD